MKLTVKNFMPFGYYVSADSHVDDYLSGGVVHRGRPQYFLKRAEAEAAKKKCEESL